MIYLLWKFVKFKIVHVFFFCDYESVIFSWTYCLIISDSPTIFYETTELISETTAVNEEFHARSFGNNDTTDSSIIEETTIFLEPTPNQEEVLNELQDIWNYSENLDDSQSQLKTSLTSLVHLTYGRLQTEPDETLDRLKYLLKKLRTTLNPNKDEEHNERSRKTRSILHDIDELYGIGEVENILFPEDYHNVFSSTGKKYLLEPEHQPTSSSFPPPQDSTVQKAIRVEDNNPRIESTTPIPFNIAKLILSQHSSTTAKPEKSGNVEKSNPGEPSKRFRTTTPSSVTAEQIANSILKLLNKNQNNEVSGGSVSESTTAKYATSAPVTISAQPAYMIPILNNHDSDFLLPNDKPDLEHSFLYFQQYMKKLRRKQKQREKLKNAMKYYHHLKTSTTTPSTTPLPLPSYFQNNQNLLQVQAGSGTGNNNNNELAGTMLSVTLPKPHKQEVTTSRYTPITKKRLSTSTSSVSSPSDYDYLLEDTDIAETESPGTIEPVTPTEELTPILLHILDELSTTNINLSPGLILNGTREGFTVLITTFNSLKFSTKMVFLFILSVSVLSIALGIYSFGPPIIAVGVLGVLIPIILLVLLQNEAEKRKQLKQDKVGNKHVDNLDNVLDLISDAINKYDVEK